MSFAPKPGAPRLLGTRTANVVKPGLPRASFNGIEFPVNRPLSTKTGGKSVQPKTK